VNTKTLFNLITLFPSIFTSVFQKEAGLLGKAHHDGLFCVNYVDLRGYGLGPHLKVDEHPYGGGAGMLMRIDPMVQAIRDVKKKDPDTRIILLSPDGVPLEQMHVERLSQQDSITLICPRYEGVDARIHYYVDESISIGDYILSGGEYAAIVLIDALMRLKQGMLGNQHSSQEESFSHKGRLEYAQYTKPLTYEEHGVPDVLLSGHHQAIWSYRLRSSIEKTLSVRPELINRYPLTREELALLKINKK